MIKEAYEKISREGCKICNGKFWVEYYNGMTLVKEECYCREVEREYWLLIGEEE